MRQAQRCDDPARQPQIEFGVTVEVRELLAPEEQCSTSSNWRRLRGNTFDSRKLIE